MLLDAGRVPCPLGIAQGESLELASKGTYDRGYLGVPLLKAGRWADGSRAIRQVIASVRLASEVREAYLLCLQANSGDFPAHTDTDFGTDDGQKARFHLPLITHPSVRLYLWDSAGSRTDHHMLVGHVYYFDPRNPHAIGNPSATNRIHLVVDVTVDQAVRRLIGAAQEAV